MRKLRLKREKKFAGSLSKVLIYYADDFDPDTINKNNCKFLDALKNGKMIEVDIPDEEITLIAAYDSLGYFMVTDYIVIPCGTNDIDLSGMVILSPIKGNPFKFLK